MFSLNRVVFFHNFGKTFSIVAAKKSRQDCMLYEAIMRTSSKAQLIFAWHIYAIATTAHYPQKHIFSYPKSHSNYCSDITYPVLCWALKNSNESFWNQNQNLIPLCSPKIKSETCYEGKISGGWPTRMFDLPENLKGLYFMHSPRRFFSQASKAADGRRRIEKFHFFLLLLHCFLASNSNNNFWLQSHKFLIGSIKMTLSSTLKALTVIEKKLNSSKENFLYKKVMRFW